MHTPGIFHIPCICHTYSIHIAFILRITRIFHAYYFHIPYIFQASEPGTVFHVIPSAPPSPRAHSLPLSHVAFACTSRVATCSDLGQDGRHIFGSISMRTDSTQGSFNGHCKLAQELNISCKRCRMYSELFSFLWQLLLWGGRV